MRGAPQKVRGDPAESAWDGLSNKAAQSARREGFTIFGGKDLLLAELSGITSGGELTRLAEFDRSLTGFGRVFYK